MRRTEGCVRCGECREIAARGLCFTCYRRDARAREGIPEFVDRHNPGIRREQKKLIRGFAAIMGGLSDLGVSRPDVLAVCNRLMPYLVTVADYLGFPTVNGARVNGDRARSAFTVHRGEDKPVGSVQEDPKCAM
jgi:hypothetical protein